MIQFTNLQSVRQLAVMSLLAAALGLSSAAAQTPSTSSQSAPASQTQAPAKPATPDTKATPSTPTPSTPAPATPPTSTPSTTQPPASTTPNPATTPASPKAGEKAPLGTQTSPPDKTEIERNAPGIPDNATTENVDVPARPVAMVSGQSSYDDAFKSIKASLDKVTAAMAKAGLKASGHPITVFSEPDENGFKYIAAVPLPAKPDKTDLGDGVTIGTSPAGKAIKFQHRGAYDDIDSTYDVITAYLDAKGLQVDNPYIEEYLTELKTADDPNLQVDIYVFIK